MLADADAEAVVEGDGEGDLDLEMFRIIDCGFCCLGMSRWPDWEEDRVTALSGRAAVRAAARFAAAVGSSAASSGAEGGVASVGSQSGHMESN